MTEYDCLERALPVGVFSRPLVVQHTLNEPYGNLDSSLSEWRGGESTLCADWISSLELSCYISR